MPDRNEPLAEVKARRDSALKALADSVPYTAWLGVRFDRRGDELTAVLPFSDRLIGNPVLPALHGGVTAAFLEMAAIVELSWAATDGTLSFLWREQTRLAVAREQRRGFGTRFLEDAVPYELGGSARLALSPDGVEYRAEIPLQGNAA